ncbi:hypothetical protein BABINDRAFT_32295 [Babjeviella inositovora NRRL Y-12698]|uniref:assimilatory sulfite reductase (NADPH) n=1 Tax=Babjeviella inositovora NRRL Y-12698 TaxID=984486 RepID=A0A1E3QWS2_9ASCO|nr:uncharacterized protein BABINDRAFT_32295 [Babjeviella inositovora NRRL Y-12698]ODQ82133.1 hypothetical protein BABINDRAFT_32295 [Babjeviella inositovora NRRL Y-12698]
MTIEKTSISASAVAPFGLPADPDSLHGVAYTSPHTLVSQTVYSTAAKVFAYKSAGALESSVQLWEAFGRANPQEIVPSLTALEVRSGAANAILGYLSQRASHTALPVLTPGSALNFIQPTLAGLTADKLPLSFQVAALDYDEATSSLVADYVSPLKFARELGYSVVTPLSAAEAQHMTLLSLALSKLQPSLHLYDGPAFLRENGRIENVLSPTELAAAYTQLAAQTPLWESLPVAKRPAAALSALNAIFDTAYQPFEYAGHAEPTTVFVVYGTVESELLLQTVATLAADAKIGAVAIRVPLPFDTAAFAATIPASAKSVVVLGQTVGVATTSALKADVAAALFWESGIAAPSVSEFTYPASFIWSPLILRKVLSSFVVLPEAAAKPVVYSQDATTAASPHGSFVFWSPDNGQFVEVASKLAHALSLDGASRVNYRAKYDNVNGAGSVHAQIASVPVAENSVPGSVDAADVVFVEGTQILSAYDVISTAREGATVLLGVSTGVVDLTEFVEKLPISFKRDLAANKNKLVVVDTAAVEFPETEGYTASIVVQVAFWRTVLPKLGDHVVQKLWQSQGSGIELLPSILTTLASKCDELAVKPVEVVPEWAQLVEELKEGETSDPLPFLALETAFSGNPRTSEAAGEPEHSVYVSAAKRLAFKEAYGTTTSLRPDLSVRNFVVKVQENRRVTPSDYDRNIFHIEFDITGTGLTYDIGEALGIHGRNDSALVQQFLDLYGLEGADLVVVPNRDDAKLVETRTVFQAFSENLDLFGKPPKRFYESLAPFATEEAERKQLELLGSAEGAADLKKRQEENVADSYADVFAEFPSARPALSDLVQIIAPLKRREYSIASSQKMHPNAVHLLIVVVDWVDSRGRTRFGHCSKYLAELAVGTELVVSVKPSVMKLPPLSTQPIIMSGLGTGLAPFKAFVEEKIWQKQQGMEIGAVYLYLGARHKKEEYLYGELWEAYKAAGIVTHIGAAFSRDQPEKIYIQDRIRENIEELTDAVMEQNGSFYLCGPTWPVPDITACLEDVVKNDAQKTGKKVDAAHEVEEMKEAGRYILEVY